MAPGTARARAFIARSAFDSLKALQAFVGAVAKKRKLADPVHPDASRRDQGAAVEPRIDPVYGQRSALPGLDDGASDGELSDETFVEAIAYLRSVRREAQGIPNLLCAPVQGESDNPATHPALVDSARGGFYQDGAYIAAPHPSALNHSELDLRNQDVQYQDAESENGDYDENSKNVSAALVEPQRAYHALLLARFNALRSSAYLSGSPPSSLPYPYLDSVAHPTCINRSISASNESAKWSRILQTTAPRSTQVVTMSQVTVLWLLERLPSMLKRKKLAAENGSSGKVLGAWIWALLGRLGDLGTLSSEEVSVVRELGKRAGSIVVGMELAATDQEVDLGAGEEEDDDGLVENIHAEDALNSTSSAIDDGGSDRWPGVRQQENPTEIGEGNDYEGKNASQAAFDAAKARLLAAYISCPTSDGQSGQERVNTASDAVGAPSRLQEDTLTATLDMVLTIVGEFYGQRDLLVARDRLWQRSIRNED